MSDKFEIVGIKKERWEEPEQKKRQSEKFPFFSAALFCLIVAGCLLGKWIAVKAPAWMDLQNGSTPPCREFLFGTDTMGRDIFSMIWSGGRVSLFIGAASTLLSTGIAIVFGAFAGSAPSWLDGLLMRLADILLSVPGLLLVVFVQALFGKASVLSISAVIGVTGWMSIARVVRTQVKQIRSSEYVIASECMGGGFFHVLWRHLAPNFAPSIMFMVIMNIRSAITAESTLSFMGIGLPVEVISWGSILSLADGALISGAWWMIGIPGLFLVATLMCLTDIGNYLRRRMNQKERNL